MVHPLGEKRSLDTALEVFAQWLLPPRKSFLEVFVKTDLGPYSDLILACQLYGAVAFVRLDGLQQFTLKAC